MKILFLLLLPVLLMGKVSEKEIDRAEQLYLNYKFKEAYPIIKQAAADGNRKGLFLLADYYMCGYNTVSINYFKANSLSKRSADLGSLSALYRLAYNRYRGKGVIQNRPAAEIELQGLFPLIRDQYEEGDDLVSMFIYPIIYLSGVGTKKDIHKSYEAYQKYEKKLGKMSQGVKGYFYLLGPLPRDADQAIKHFLLGAKGGDGTLQCSLSSIYFYDKKDINKALEWAHISAKQKHPGAAKGLSRVYQYKSLHSHNFLRSYINFILSKYWITKAALWGDFTAWNPVLLLMTGNINQE